MGTKDDAAPRYRAGLERRQRGDLDGAANCFAEAVIADPLLFEAAGALAETIAAEVRAGSVAVPAHVMPAAPIPKFSVVVCSNRPQRFARVVETYKRVFTGVGCEIVGVHDAKSLCEGYNRGVRASHGQVVVLSHDDVDVIAPDFLARLVGAVRHFDIVGVAGATRLTGPAWAWAGHPDVHGWVTHRPGGTGSWRPAFWSVWPRVRDAVVLDGCFMAAHRRVLEAVQFDEATFDGFHGYDVDFTYRAGRTGFTVGVCGELGLVHESVGSYDVTWRLYADRFVAKFPECREAPRPSHRYEAAVDTPQQAHAFFTRLGGLVERRLTLKEARA